MLLVLINKINPTSLNLTFSMDGIYDNENMRIIDEDGNEYRATDFGMNTKNKVLHQNSWLIFF